MHPGGISSRCRRRWRKRSGTSRLPSAKGFGSVKVTASIAGNSWSTSVFPESKSHSYVLPVKKAIRTATGISDGDDVDVELVLELQG